MSKPKPKWGFRPVADKIPIPKKVIQVIEKKTGITLKKGLRDRLIESLSEYLSTKEMVENYPRRSESRAALEEINQLTDKLVYFLKELDSRSRRILTLQSEWVDIEETISNLEILQSTTEDALKSLPLDKGGRRPNRALKSLIKDLIEIYEQATGKKAGMPGKDEVTEKYSGPFFRFVDTCLEVINCPAYSNEALAQEIKRILIAPKKHS